MYKNFMKNYEVYYNKLSIDKQNFENDLQAQFLLKCNKLQKISNKLAQIELQID